MSREASSDQAQRAQFNGHRGGEIPEGEREASERELGCELRSTEGRDRCECQSYDEEDGHVSRSAHPTVDLAALAEVEWGGARDEDETRRRRIAPWQEEAREKRE